MSVSNDLERIIEEVDLLVAELRELNEEGPHFRIVHRFHTPGTHCAPGEEVAGIYLVHRSQEYHLLLSLALRLLFDYLARNCHLPQSATQIEAGFRSERFYEEHGAAVVMLSGSLRRSIPRTYIRVYMERLEAALNVILKRANLALNPNAVLVSEQTVMNEVGYRLQATFEWIRIPV